jgi:hypothetical protein
MQVVLVLQFRAMALIALTTRRRNIRKLLDICDGVALLSTSFVFGDCLALAVTTRISEMKTVVAFFICIPAPIVPKIEQAS